MLQFQNEEVCTWVGGLAEVFKSDFADEVDVLSRFCVGQRLWCTDAVLEFERGNACIVLHGISNRWVQQHGIGQAVDAACGGQTCVHTDSFCIVPRWVDSEMPGDFFAVGHVGYRGRGFELDVILLVAGFRERHEVAPCELDVAGFSLKGQPGFRERRAGERVNSMRGHHFVNVAVGVKPDWVVGHCKRVGVAGAGGDAQIAERDTTARIRINGHRNAGGCTASPECDALIQFNVKAVSRIEGGFVVVNDVQVHEVDGGAR